RVTMSPPSGIRTTGAIYAAHPITEVAAPGTGPPESPNQSTQARNTPAARSPSPTSSALWWPRARLRRRFLTRAGVFGRGLAGRYGVLAPSWATARRTTGLLLRRSLAESRQAVRDQLDETASVDVEADGRVRRVGLEAAAPVHVRPPATLLPAAVDLDVCG